MKKLVRKARQKWHADINDSVKRLRSDMQSIAESLHNGLRNDVQDIANDLHGKFQITAETLQNGLRNDVQDIANDLHGKFQITAETLQNDLRVTTANLQDSVQNTISELHDLAGFIFNDAVLSRYNTLPLVEGNTWFANYSSYDDYAHDIPVLEYAKKTEAIWKDFIVSQRLPMQFYAYCEVCGHMKPMTIHSRYRGEVFLCSCGLNSRQRAMYEYIKNVTPPPPPRKKQENIYNRSNHPVLSGL